MEMGAERGKKGEKGGREIIPLTGLQEEFFSSTFWFGLKLNCQKQ